MEKSYDIADSLFMSEIEEDNHTIMFKIDSYNNMVMEVRIFNTILQGFKLYSFEVSAKKGNEEENFIKNNFHRFFQANGMIEPIL